MATKTEKMEEAATEAGYSKEQFLHSAKFAEHRDVVNALLEDGQLYTLDQVEGILKQFYRKEAE